MPDEPPKHRSGSETRKRSVTLWTRVTPEEARQFEQAAEKAGVSVSSLLRHCALNTPLPRARPRSGADVQAVIRLMGRLSELKAEAGKIGSNVNQVAHGINIWLQGGGRAPDRMLNLIE